MVFLKLKNVYIKLVCFLYYFLRFRDFKFGSVLCKPRLLINAKKISIGKATKIERDAVLYCVSTYHNQAYNGIIVIGNNCYINSTFNITCTGYVKIEDNVTIAYNVSIFDNIHGTDPSIGNYNRQPLIKRPQITIADGAWIGANCFIMSSVGKCSIIGANSVVTKPVPDYCIAAGNPARVIKRYDFEKRKWVKV